MWLPLLFVLLIIQKSRDIKTNIILTLEYSVDY